MLTEHKLFIERSVRLLPLKKIQLIWRGREWQFEIDIYFGKDTTGVGLTYKLLHPQSSHLFSADLVPSYDITPFQLILPEGIGICRPFLYTNFFPEFSFCLRKRKVLSSTLVFSHLCLDEFPLLKSHKQSKSISLVEFPRLKSMLDTLLYLLIILLVFLGILKY